MSNLSDESLVLLEKIKILGNEIDKIKNNKFYISIDTKHPFYSIIKETLNGKDFIIEAIKPTEYLNNSYKPLTKH